MADQKIFAGSSPYDRWMKELKKYLAVPSIAALLASMGTKADRKSVV